MGADVENVQKRGLARLLLRWPEHRARLRTQIANDPYLLELIGAHEAACEAVDYWSRSQSPIAGERVEEYRQLSIATEQDILGKIGQMRTN